MPITVNLNDQAALQKFLARRHPEYVDLLPHWQFYEDTYKGNRKWFERNIFRYIKEGDQEFSERVARAYRPNHTKEVVDLVQKYIFKSDVARNWDDAPDYLKKFWKDTTLSNLKIEQFMRLVSTRSSVEGRIWVFADSTKNDTVVSKADEVDAGSRCYAYIVGPRDVLDIGFDEHEKPTWMLVRELVRDDQDPINATGAVRERYRLWTIDAWYLFEIRSNNASTPQGLIQPIVDGSSPTNGVTIAQFQNLTLPGTTPAILTASGDTSVQVHLVDQGELKLGRLPCFPVDNVIGDNKYSAPSMIADIAYLDRAVANYLSNLDAIIQDQTFSQLAMPAQNVLPGDSKYEALMEMGTKRVFTYDGESGQPPFYLSPDVKQAAIIITVVNKIISEIYHSLGMGGERTKQDNAVGIDNSSGVAKAYDFERLNSLLTTKSQSLQNAEVNLIELLALWNGSESPIESDDDGEQTLVQYADTFDIRSLFDEFTVAERLTLIDAPELVRQQQMSQVIDKLFPALKADLKKAMLDQLKTWPITAADQVQIQGVMTGNPTATFPAKLTSKTSPNMPSPMIPQVPPAPVSAPGAKGKKKAKSSGSAHKNPSTANRQGQVTS